MPLVGPGQSPGRGFRGRFSVFKNGLESSPLHYFVKRIIAFSRFSVLRHIEKIEDCMFYLKPVARKICIPDFRPP